MAKIIGIDLGTTNSLVATVRSGEAKTLSNSQGRDMLPSVVRYTADNVVVGDAAMAAAVLAGPAAAATLLAGAALFPGGASAAEAEDVPRLPSVHSPPIGQLLVQLHTGRPCQERIHKLEGGPNILGARMPFGGPFLDQETINRIRAIGSLERSRGGSSGSSRSTRGPGLPRRRGSCSEGVDPPPQRSPSTR